MILVVSAFESTIEPAFNDTSLVVTNSPNVNTPVALYLIFEAVASVEVVLPIVIVTASTSTVPVAITFAFWVKLFEAWILKFPNVFKSLLNTTFPFVALISVSLFEDTTAFSVTSISPCVLTKIILSVDTKFSCASFVVAVIVPSLFTLFTFTSTESIETVSVSVTNRPFPAFALNVSIFVSKWLFTLPTAPVISNNKLEAIISTCSSVSIKFPPAVIETLDVFASIVSIVTSLFASNKIFPPFSTDTNVSIAIVISFPDFNSIVLFATTAFTSAFNSISFVASNVIFPLFDVKSLFNVIVSFDFNSTLSWATILSLTLIAPDSITKLPALVISLCVAWLAVRVATPLLATLFTSTSTLFTSTAFASVIYTSDPLFTVITSTVVFKWLLPSPIDNPVFNNKSFAMISEFSSISLSVVPA